MKIEIGDTSLILILLLEECNYTCAHCIREDEPMDRGYRLSFRQLQRCLADCRSLESIRWVHFSGGEPTLWTEGELGLVDLLIEIAQAGFIPGFTTNGSYFVHYSKCRDLFTKYLDATEMPLRLYLSIDTFHRNFNVKSGRSHSLDNVMKFKRESPRAKSDLLETHVLATVSKEAKSLLPDEMIRHYESLGVDFVFTPLQPIGRGESLRHLCPDLNSSNPEDLGVYQRYHRETQRQESDGTEEQDRADHMNLIGDHYYFHRPWRKVGQLGQLPDTIVRAYSGVAGA
jgi:MoaA/NifB/PqqE/SkfB family radical SAM enzyme